MQKLPTKSICVPDIYQAVTRDIAKKVNERLVAFLVALICCSDAQTSSFAIYLLQGIGQMFLLPGLLQKACYIPLYDHELTAKVIESYVGKWSGKEEDWGYSEPPVFPDEKNIDYCASMTLLCERGTIVITRDDLRAKFCVFLSDKCKSDYEPVDHGTCGRSCPQRCNQKDCKGGFQPVLKDWDALKNDEEFANKWYQWQQHFNHTHMLSSPYSLSISTYSGAAPSITKTAEFYKLNAKEISMHIEMLYNDHNRPIVHKFLSELWLRLERMYCKPPVKLNVEPNKWFHRPFDKDKIWVYVIAMIRCCVKKW